ncbi:MAG: class I SAM-dependent methyltransferase [Acidimicrobiia bacterium]
MQREIPEHPAFEVGAGPGHIGGYLRARGVPVVASDASPAQMAQARILDPTLPIVVADLARLPSRPESLGAVVAFYCLIYGPTDLLDGALRDWHQALVPNGLVLIAVHAGVGSLSVEEWQGRRCELTMELRDPDDLARRLQAQGFVIERQVTRPPYDAEHATDRAYILARRAP